jgi:peroxiredoxin
MRTVWSAIDVRAGKAARGGSIGGTRDNRIWPTVYVIDQKGRVRYVWVGELAWEGAKGAETVRDFVRSLLDGKRNDDAGA